MRGVELPAVLATSPEMAREILRALLHVIVFHRALGPMRSITDRIASLDVYYERCDQNSFYNQIEAALDSYFGRPRYRGDVLKLTFHERKVTQGWLFQSEALVSWESWTLSLSLRDGASEADIKPRVRANTIGLIEKILGVVNENQATLPPLGANGSNPFPFDILPSPASTS